MAKLINILLQKSDPEYPWGFSLGAQPLAHHSVQITWVDGASLASQHLETGDRVLEIEGMDTTILSNSEVESLLKSPSKKLELLIMKKPKVSVAIQSGKTEKMFEREVKKETSLQTNGNEERIGRVQTDERPFKGRKKSSDKQVSFEVKDKVDRFWTSPPADLKQTKELTTSTSADLIKGQNKSSYISQSAIFQNLNNYKDELRRSDPREDKRKFWESCRKGDSVRRFKWGDSIKPFRVTSPYSKSDGSSESLYFKAEVSEPKNCDFQIERSKSCEPNDLNITNPFYPINNLNCSNEKQTIVTSNPFSPKFNETQPPLIPEISVTEENPTEVYEEIEYVSNENHNLQEENKYNINSIENQDQMSNDSLREEEFIFEAVDQESGGKITNLTYEQEFNNNVPQNCLNFNELCSPEMNQTNKKALPMVPSVRVPPVIPARICKSNSSEDFNTKYEFFEKATSVPISCINKNAKDLVEEKMNSKELSSSSPPVSILPKAETYYVGTFKDSPDNYSDVVYDVPQITPVCRKSSSPNNLRKPSDFLHREFNKPEIKHEQEARGESLERDIFEHKKRVFTESSYEKVTRNPMSPYENVESGCRREYKEEELIKPVKNFKERSKTPSGFYDNHFEEMYRDYKSKYISENQPETFENIRNKMGELFGGKPIGPVRKIQKSRKEERAESIEEAFRQLAMKEGLYDEITPGEYYYDYSRQSSQIAASNGSTGPSGGDSMGAAPPPPPPPVHGTLPSVKIASEIGAKKHYEPPAAIQNAMMTKDKKPFTYTPGGLDLAEIRSPRMARRINRNAHMEDSCSGQPQPRPGGLPQQPLPPSALAAMQPQIAIPVFPPGSGFPCSPSNVPTSPPPMMNVPSQMGPVGFPPPPPPPMNCNVTVPDSNIDFPPPPPPMQYPGTPPTPTGAMNFPPPPPPPMPDPNATYSNNQNQANNNQNGNFVKNGQRSPPNYLSDIQNHPPLRSVGPINQSRPPPDFVAEIPCHAPLKPINQVPRSSYEPSVASPIQVQLKPISPKTISVTNPTPPYVPQQPQMQPLSPETISHMRPHVHIPPPPPQSEPPARPVNVQNVRVVAPPLYIPPSNQSTPSPTITPGTGKQTPSTPANLNKSPAPWMTSRQQSKDSPPPWTVKQSSIESPQTPASGPIMRVIPIQIEGRDPSPMAQQQMQQTQSTVYQQQQVQTTRQEQQVRTRIIPIQIEGGERNIESPRGFTTQQSLPNQGNPPSGYVQNKFNQTTPQHENLQRNSSVDGSDWNRQLQSQVSWTPGTSNPIQSRSFRVLQKITGSEEEATGPYQNPGAETYLVNRVYPQQATAPVGADSNMCWDPNTPTPPPYYPNPNYWYYPPQTPEEQQQFWEHYNAMYAYMAQMNAAACRYSPYPMYPYMPPGYPSDSEEYSGYSSSDEMTYYGQMFKKQAEMAYQAQQAAQYQQPVAAPLYQTPSSSNNSNSSIESKNLSTSTSQGTILEEEEEEEEESDGSSDTDTEIDNNEQLNALQSIKSVPNINVYNESDNSESQSEESDSEEESEAESEIPHQLSVIFEESEQSSDAESCKKQTLQKNNYESDGGSSTATLNNQEEDEDNAPVVVRLPLQFKISRSENDEEVTTVIVGNSEVETTPDGNEQDDGNLIITEIIKEDSDPDVTATINLKTFKTRSQSDASQIAVAESIKSDSESPIDFWKDMPDKDSDNAKSPHSVQSQISEDDSKHDESDYHWEDDSSSTSIQTVKKGRSESENFSGSEVEVPSNVDEIETGVSLDDIEEMNSQLHKEKCVIEETEQLVDNDNDSSDDSSSSEEETDDSDEESSETSSSASSEEVNKENKNNSSSVVEQREPLDTENGPRSKLEKLKSASLEESEEDDSGVTSDISRHISETDTGSDPECGNEMRKMTRYQRAATHSRLFKLLQDECCLEENMEEEPLSAKKERLTLPLHTQITGEQESLSSSSGVNSPSSPTTTDRLVKELVQSLLSRKKGRHFRKLPLEKLHAAALRILQEDMDPYDTGSTSDDSSFFLSPVSNPQSQSSDLNDSHVSDVPNPETYGANYYDYCNYYSSWGNPDVYRPTADFEDYDILPSKTFKILQENAPPETFPPQPSKGIMVRCPRVLSSQSNSPNQTSESTLTPREPETSPTGPQET